MSHRRALLVSLPITAALAACSACSPALLQRVLDDGTASVAEREVAATAEVRVVCRERYGDALLHSLVEIEGDDGSADEGSGSGSAGALPTEEDEGTGVVVAPGRVLTAKHVVDCVDEDTGEQMDAVSVQVRLSHPGVPEAADPALAFDAGDGWRDADVEVLLPERDVARLRVPGLAPGAPAFAVGPPPRVGEVLCISAAVPRDSYKCGTAQPPREAADLPTAPGAPLISVDAYVEFGNSGAGVYDSLGRIVGLAMAAERCQDGRHCVGWVAPLRGAEWVARP